MRNYKDWIYLGLNIVLLLTLGLSLGIYTSLIKGVPWYDPCGLQFLGIFMITLPALVVIGFGLMVLNKNYRMDKRNIYIPVLGILGFILPILIDGSLGPLMQGIGILSGGLLFLMTFLVTGPHMYKIFKTKS